MSDYGQNEELRMRQLRHALDEAKRFQRCAEAAINAYESETGNAYRCVEYAAAKRASMDLTRALVPLRRSVYR